MTPAEYASLDGLALAELVRSGQITPPELLDLALARIDAVDPLLHAIVHRWDERARARAAGPLDGPFAGVPSLLKDMLELDGTPMTMGSALLTDHVCDHTHPLAARYQAAGLVFAGRTNMSELGLLPLTEPRRYGPTANPWDPTRSPGGSSGGAAAAVASGMVPVAHAADGGGSIRIPASACGLFGLKPSRGRQPREAMDEPDGFTSHHVITRTVRDSAAMLDATAVRSPVPTGRWWVPPLAGSFLEAAGRDPEPLRVGFTLRGLRGERLHPAAERAVEEAARLLESLGHRVEEVPSPVDGEAFTRAFRILWTAVGGVFIKLAARSLAQQGGLPRWLQQLLVRHPDVLREATALPVADDGGPLLEPLLRRLARQDAQLAPSDLWLAQVDLQHTAAALSAYYQGHDLLLTTVLSEPPWRTGSLSQRLPDDVLAERLWSYIAFTPVANATGLPAAAVPMTVSEAGVPMGVQLMAPMAREDLLFAVSGQLERARPWVGSLPTG